MHLLHERDDLLPGLRLHQGVLAAAARQHAPQHGHYPAQVLVALAQQPAGGTQQHSPGGIRPPGRLCLKRLASSAWCLSSICITPLGIHCQLRWECALTSQTEIMKGSRAVSTDRNMLECLANPPLQTCVLEASSGQGRRVGVHAIQTSRAKATARYHPQRPSSCVQNTAW